MSQEVTDRYRAIPLPVSVKTAGHCPCRKTRSIVTRRWFAEVDSWHALLPSGPPARPVRIYWRPPNAIIRLLQAHLIQLEYVWVGGLSALDMRCKTRTWTKAEAPK